METNELNVEEFIAREVQAIKDQVGDRNVICGLSGGVDSSVAAALVHKAVGDQLTCIFVDHGLLRKNEADEVMQVFAEDFHMNIIKVDAKERFLSKLQGVTDPEQKRKIIGNEFIYVFDDEAAPQAGGQAGCEDGGQRNLRSVPVLYLGQQHSGLWYDGSDGCQGRGTEFGVFRVRGVCAGRPSGADGGI